jgi:hypothetical protein
MIIHINDKRMLREIQLDFSRFYPYLRMEFYENEKSANNPPFDRSHIDPYVRLGNIRNKHHAGALNLMPGTTINSLKTWMKNEFDLYIQVFHYTAWGWVSANNLDMAELEELNEQGRHCFHEIHNVSAQSKNLF